MMSASAIPGATPVTIPTATDPLGFPRASALQAAARIVHRDLRLAFRNRGQWIQPIAFFVIVITMFPLAFTPELGRLREVAPGVLWIAALLASLLALEFLFREDARDGTLEQFVLSGQSLTWLLVAKTGTHWLLTGLPLALVAPLMGGTLGVPVTAMPDIVAALLLGTMSLSLIGAIGAALTLGVKRGGVLLSLLTLPLAVPVMIFGARATELAIRGVSAAAPLYLLAALTVLGLTLAPLAAAAGVRISLE
jgi:heme exporter protein B